MFTLNHSKLKKNFYTQSVLRIRIRDPVLFYPPGRGPDTGSGMEQWSDPGSGAFLAPGSGIRIRDGAMVGSGSGIKHPGSATLHPVPICSYGIVNLKILN
jgi:hypothetical protein